jgi:hypothetical protein
VTVMAAEAAPAIAEGVTSAGEGATARGAAAGGAAGQPKRKSRKEQYQKATKYVPRGKISRTDYQPVILVEFVACILLTAATPIATKKDQQGLSPYAGKDIVKLSAITIVYLILAAISVGGRGPGRVAAWFGGLILLADGLYEASNIVRDLRVFSGAGAGAAAGTASESPVPGGILPTPTGTQPVLGEVPSG